MTLLQHADAVAALPEIVLAVLAMALLMFGVFSMWIFGFMTYLFPQLWGRPWASRRLCEWHYWLSAAGVFIMFLDLALAGIFQGYYFCRPTTFAAAPLPALPEMRLRSPAAVPPMIVPMAPPWIFTPSAPLPIAAVPVALVPIRLAWMVLPFAPAALTTTPK